MSILAESILAAFHSNSEIVWSLGSSQIAVARFSVASTRVTVSFESADSGEWIVSSHIGSQVSLAEGMGPAIRTLSGIFQAVKEFLEVRQPERLAFASKEEPLGFLYDTYLSRRGTELQRLGYKAEMTNKYPPSEFSIVKSTPSEWKVQ